MQQQPPPTPPSAFIAKGLTLSCSFQCVVLGDEDAGKQTLLYSYTEGVNFDPFGFHPTVFEKNSVTLMASYS